jgi:topoisomerase-4 subunit B
MAQQGSSSYNADAIEVLSGLDPVRKRPGMYTDTSRPNHLAQEVIDNSVDEALAGHAKSIQVILHEDNSLEVLDDGRGMPVDIHPEEGVPGVELILTKLHAGGKFSNKNYQFSGGLHGVGISVVNALSTRVVVTVKRDGNEYQMSFADGYKSSDLAVVGTVGKRNTGTSVHFWPDPKYFDAFKFSVSRLKHVLKAKAVLCPGLAVSFEDKSSGEKVEWLYEDGLRSYLVDAVSEFERLPNEPFCGSLAGNKEAVDWALLWLPEGGDAVQESYVNLIPTAQGGTHVNGLRQGLLDAMREFCEFRSLLPRGVKLAPEDIWERIAFVLSMKMQDAQFSGRRLSPVWSRMLLACGSTATRNSVSSSLNWRSATPTAASRPARRSSASASPKARRCPASWPIVPAKTRCVPSCFWWRVIPPVARPSRRAIKSFRRSCRCAGKF